MVDQAGQWKWHLFESFLPRDILLRIVVVKPPSFSTIADSIGWHGNRDRRFTIKYAYSLISNGEISPPNPVWKVLLGRDIEVYAYIKMASSVLLHLELDMKLFIAVEVYQMFHLVWNFLLDYASLWVRQTLKLRIEKASKRQASWRNFGN
ncbi:hypothetical protein V6N11_009818 [Hibiscus sabdariffa]|uniref:Uncharacterized protein n=2 Tax=Hibiscus sabdariffa TaxID=183260 RepID=A0ABR1ZLP7_9ROSI